MKKTKVINLLGAPSSRKSTFSAEIYSRLKKRGRSVESTKEFAKKYAYDGKIPDVLDQLVIFGGELDQQKSLFGKVSILVTDSPIYLASFYSYLRSGDDFLFSATEKAVDYSVSELGVSYYNFFLEKIEGTHEDEGRFEDESESLFVEKTMLDWLRGHNIPFDFLSKELSEEARFQKIISKVSLVKN